VIRRIRSNDEGTALPRLLRRVANPDQLAQPFSQFAAAQVRVRVVRVATPDGTDGTQRYLLQWINDPPPTYPASHAGITCEPGLDPHAYISVAYKRVDRADISLCFANDKLVGQTYTAMDLDLELAVDSRDEASDVAGPTVTERFRLTVTTGDSLSLTRIA